MPVAAVSAAAGAVSSAVKSVESALGIHTGSPRYENGPLVTTVQGKLAQVRQGGTVAQSALDSITPTRLASDKDATAWRDVWNNEVPKAIPDQGTANYYVQLDPSGANRLPPQFRGNTVITSVSNALGSASGKSPVLLVAAIAALVFVAFLILKAVRR